MWLLLDDIERSFVDPTGEAAMRFTEALILAANDINRTLCVGSMAVVLLFRSEVYESKLEKMPEHSHFSRAIWSLSWRAEELEQFVARRIRFAAGVSENEPDWKSWTRLFACDRRSEVDAFEDFIFERVMTGPRDVMFLVDDFARKVALAARSERIDMSHLERSAVPYGAFKLRTLGTDYERMYPALDEVVKRLFSAGRVTYSIDEVADLVDTHIRPDEKYRTKPWIGQGAASDVIRALLVTSVVAEDATTGLVSVHPALVDALR